MISLDSEHLRLIWGIIETHSCTLQGLSDDAIFLWLQKKLRDNIQLSHDDMQEIQGYLLSRSHLIREVANAERV